MHIEKFLTLQRWRRRSFVSFLGICAALALPPFFVLPLLVPAFSGLFLFVYRAKNPRQAFSDGWWWGFGHFTVGLYWICISLWVDADYKFAWMTPAALFGIPSVLAVYTGLVACALHHIRRKYALQAGTLIVVFALLWTGSEYLRAIFFTGFPWNLIGYVWTISDVTLQLASVTGIYGLSWLTVILASTPALWVNNFSREARRPTVCAALLLALMIGFGFFRLASHPTAYTNVKIRIVQAIIPQYTKWDPKQIAAGVRKNIRLTRSYGFDSINLVLWPETAVPYYIKAGGKTARELGSVLPKGALLLTGGLRFDDTTRQSWNAFFAIDKNGQVHAEYDKYHLVPFGEYIPMRWFLPIAAVAADLGDFTRGTGPRTLDIPPYPPFSPLICYEAIFPGVATDGKHTAKWLLSITDDAWFGFSTGPFQDVQMARTRA